jgi:hypothetical protein
MQRGHSIGEKGMREPKQRGGGCRRRLVGGRRSKTVQGWGGRAAEGGEAALRRRLCICSWSGA